MIQSRSHHAGRVLAAAVLVISAWAGGVEAQQALGPSGTANPAASSYPGAGVEGVGGDGAPGETGYVGLDGGLAYSDNAGMTSSGHTSDEMAMAGIDANYLHQGARLDVSGVGQIDWVQYLHHTFGGTPYGHFLGNATWGHTTDLLQWVLNETFGEGTADPLSAPTPDNIEYVNYFTTGPYLNFNFGPADRATLHGLYSRTTYQSSPYDAQSLDGGASLAHAFSPRSNLTLQADYVRTRFIDETVAPEYDTRTASLAYRAAGGRTTFSAAAGYTFVNYRGPQSGAPLFEVQLSRRVSPFSSIYASAQTGLTTAGDALSGSLGTPVSAATLTASAPMTTSTAPFKERSASAGWDFNRARTTLSIYGTIAKRQYQQQVAGSAGGLSGILGGDIRIRMEEDRFGLADFDPVAARQRRPLLLGIATESSRLDNTYKSISGSLSRKLRPTVVLALRASRTWAQYENLDGNYVDTYVTLSLSKQFRRTMIAAYAMRRHRAVSGTAPQASDDSFDEDVFGLFVTYDLAGHRFLGGAMPGLPGVPGMSGF